MTKTKFPKLSKLCSCGNSANATPQLRQGRNMFGQLVVWNYTGCPNCNLPVGKVTMTIDKNNVKQVS